MKILIFIICIFLFIGCNTIKYYVPDESYNVNVKRLSTSIINLNVDLDVIRLESVINSQLDSVLYQDTSFTDDNIKIKVWKAGDIKLKFEEDELSWELPARISFQKLVKVFGYNLSYLSSFEYTGEIKLRYKTKLMVNRDWSIKTTTKFNDYVWVKKPIVKIGSLDVPITYIVNLFLSHYLNTFSNQIDGLCNNLNLREYVEKGWCTLFDPFKIPGDYNAWLTINPYSICIIPIKGSEGHIRFSSAITSDVMCLLDSVPLSIKDSPLPFIETLKISSDTFKINMLTDIPYSTINQIIKKDVGDSTFVFGNRRIRFETFRVYGSDGKLAIETKVSGSINGKLYLVGVPYFNVEDTTIRIKELKFNIKNNIILQPLSWLFNQKIEKMLTSSIAIPFNTNISSLNSQITSTFSHYKLGYGFELNGKLVKVYVSDLYLNSESIKANIVFSGNLSLDFNE